jgi:hypothetical protein
MINNTVSHCGSVGSAYPDYLQVSLVEYVPLAGVVIDIFGSDSQVTAPLYLRIYLYWIAVEAGRLTVMLQMG